eukprot:scaffold12086_cov67-Phaeocystis_antarctica.AAC.1
MRFLGELAQARNDGIDIERASATWSTSSFTSYLPRPAALARWRCSGGSRSRSSGQSRRARASVRVRRGALETLAPGPPRGC